MIGLHVRLHVIAVCKTLVTDGAMSCVRSFLMPGDHVAEQILPHAESLATALAHVGKHSPVLVHVAA